MLGFQHIQFTGSLTSTASSTATVFAAGGSGTKWCLTKGIISAIAPAVGATLCFVETYTSGTADAGWVFRIPFGTAAANIQEVDFGTHGLQASSTNSRLAWYVDGANASANIVFVGYLR